MKHYIITVALVLFFSCAERQALKTGLEGKPIPTFDLLLADSVTYFSTASIPEGKPVILFSFEPWCPYCKAQTEDILSNAKSLSGINFYMLSTSGFAAFKNFYNEYELTKYPNIKAGIDTSYFFARYFKTGQIPYLAVFDQHKNLKQVFIGKVETNTLKKTAFN